MSERARFVPRKIYDEPISMIDLNASVNAFGLRLGVGSKIVLHQVRPHYHKHEREVDVVLTGDAGVSWSTPTVPQPAINLLRQAFVDGKLSTGTKTAYYFSDDFPLSLRQLRGHTSEHVHIAAASAGAGSFLHDRTQFAVWNANQGTVVVYDGTGGKISSPPQHLLTAFSRRWNTPLLRAIGAVTTETVGLSVITGRQRTYDFVPST